MYIRIANTIFVLLIIALQYRLWFGYANFQQISQLQDSIHSQNKEIASLNERNLKIVNDVLDLRNGGGDAVEEYAREELGMIKKGETFYQIVSLK